MITYHLRYSQTLVLGLGLSLSSHFGHRINEKCHNGMRRWRMMSCQVTLFFSSTSYYSWQRLSRIVSASMEFSEKWRSNGPSSSSFDLRLGTFFHVLPEGAEMPDKAATTNNFPDATRTIIIGGPSSSECHLDGQPAD